VKLELIFWTGFALFMAGVVTTFWPASARMRHYGPWVLLAAMVVLIVFLAAEAIGRVIG
jgi:hypothetical protein